ncbi:hypothetical protein ACIRTB_24285 [Streptomyces sp. NPDC101158]|uniref:hypothetical protein n=1 Tax=Streptomyces sp. NPDC101158 TaxID=3366117 RepID=UPI003823181E
MSPLSALIVLGTVPVPAGAAARAGRRPRPQSVTQRALDRRLDEELLTAGRAYARLHAARSARTVEA